MTENVHIDLAGELQQVLRAWAARQSPQTDFERWHMASFVQPAKLKDGPFFSGGELVLCRPAPEKAGQLTALGLVPPLAVWSFALGREVLVSPALLHREGEAFPGEALEAEASLSEKAA